MKLIGNYTEIPYIKKSEEAFTGITCIYEAEYLSLDENGNVLSRPMYYEFSTLEDSIDELCTDGPRIFIIDDKDGRHQLWRMNRSASGCKDNRSQIILKKVNMLKTIEDVAKAAFPLVDCFNNTATPYCVRDEFGVLYNEGVIYKSPDGCWLPIGTDALCAILKSETKRAIDITLIKDNNKHHVGILYDEDGKKVFEQEFNCYSEEAPFMFIEAAESFNTMLATTASTASEPEKIPTVCMYFDIHKMFYGTITAEAIPKLELFNEISPNDYSALLKTRNFIMIELSQKDDKYIAWTFAVIDGKAMPISTAEGKDMHETIDGILFPAVLDYLAPPKQEYELEDIEK